MQSLRRYCWCEMGFSGPTNYWKILDIHNTSAVAWLVEILLAL
jgi:hypothetical protein